MTNYKDACLFLIEQIFSKDDQHKMKKALAIENLDRQIFYAAQAQLFEPVEPNIKINTHISNKLLLTDNLNVIAIAGSATIIQQKPMCRNVIISQKTHTSKLFPIIPEIQSKTYFLALPYVIYIITHTPEHIFLTFSNEPLTNMNQLAYLPYLFNVGDSSYACLGKRWPLTTKSFNEIISMFWDAEFTYPTSFAFYNYRKMFSYEEWEQRTLKNQKDAINWILTQNWQTINPLAFSHATLENLQEETKNPPKQPCTFKRLIDIINVYYANAINSQANTDLMLKLQAVATYFAQKYQNRNII